MAKNTRGRNTLIAAAVIIIVILLLLTQCLREKPTPAKQGTIPPTPAASVEPTPRTAGEPAPAPAAEVLGPATVTAPPRVEAGAAFAVQWTGPGNRGDFVNIVPLEAPAATNGNYRETEHGPSLELTAPIQPGAYEVRYTTARSRTILAKTAVEVVAAGATLSADPEVTLGATVSVGWTGPNNKDDYITIVPKDAPDAQYGSYVNTEKGSPVTLTAPTAAGDAELRYVSGQGRKVLARRPIRVVAAEVSMTAPPDAIAGTTIEVLWTGPNNTGDYITVVPEGTPDGQYGNYTDASKGSPLKLLIPVVAGKAELRYMTGQGGRVLGRRPITVIAAQVTLAAPPESAAGSPVSVTWTGPNNPGDYITVVAKGTPDGQYGAYTNTTEGSPLNVDAPKTAGDAEVRYVAGQGNTVLARIPIKIVP